MNIVFCVLIGYLIGSINPAYIIGKIHGVDIREKGSGNAGASNTLITFGKVKGVICAVLDIAKPCFAIWITGKLFPAFKYTYVLAGVSCVIGHMYPFYMKFRGGKGLACLGGMVLAFEIRIFVIFLLAEIIIALITEYICFVPITASAVFPVVYGVLRKDVIGMLIIFIATFCIIFKHRENIRRIRNGTELHLSYLWNKESEIDRVQSNIGQ